MIPLTIQAPAKAPTISRINMALVESDMVVSIPFHRSFLRFLGVKRAAIPAEANRMSWLLPSRLRSPYNWTLNTRATIKKIRGLRARITARNIAQNIDLYGLQPGL
jgi:hypothetical protein